MPKHWALVLAPGVKPGRNVAGLPLASRLALNAQAAGAAAIMVSDDETRRVLADTRKLTLPILGSSSDSYDEVLLPAHAVVHRDYFEAVLRYDAEAHHTTRQGSLLKPPFPFAESGPYRFDPILVVDNASHAEAERRLFRALRKPADGWTSRYLNRHLSLALSKWLVKTPLTPNIVSIGILGIGLTGAWLASYGDPTHLLLGAVLFQAQSVLDGCDGEMSRVTYRGSLAGQWLDTIGDDLTNYSFFAAAGYGLFRAEGSLLYLASALVVVLAGSVASGLEYRYLVRIGSGDLLRYPLSQAGPSSGLGQALAPLFKRDTFVFLTLFAALIGQVGPMLVLFALGAVIVLLNVIRTELRLARERTHTRERP